MVLIYAYNYASVESIFKPNKLSELFSLILQTILIIYK